MATLFVLGKMVSATAVASYALWSYLKDPDKGLPSSPSDPHQEAAACRQLVSRHIERREEAGRWRSPARAPGDPGECELEVYREYIAACSSVLPPGARRSSPHPLPSSPRPFTFSDIRICLYAMQSDMGWNRLPFDACTSIISYVTPDSNIYTIRHTLYEYMCHLSHIQCICKRNVSAAYIKAFIWCVHLLVNCVAKEAGSRQCPDGHHQVGADTITTEIERIIRRWATRQGGATLAGWWLFMSDMYYSSPQYQTSDGYGYSMCTFSACIITVLSEMRPPLHQ